jgi:hypothetical protein
MDNPPQVDIDGFAPEIEGEVSHFASHADAGVVEHVIKAAVVAHGVVDEALNVFGAGHIEMHGDGAAAARGNGESYRLGTLEIDVGGYGESAAPGQFFRERAANAGSAPGDDSDLILK